MRYVGSSPSAFGEDRKKYVVGSGGVNAGDTVFNVSYDEGKVDAYLNGIRLFPDTDFTKTASGVGNNITLASGVGAGDVLELFGLQGVHAGNGLVEDRFVVGTGSTGSGGSYTNSTTVFPSASNVGDTVSVWRNGVKLVHTTDYTVQPAASTVTLGSAATAADEICIQVVGIVTSANFIPKTGGTFTGEVVVPTLKLSSNVIKASDGGSTITLDTSDNVTIAGGLTVTQDFTVNGTTTTVDTTNTVVKDSLIGLNNGATSNTNDCGLIIERGSTGNDALFMWDESEDKFTLGTSTSTASSTGNLNITVGTLVANLEGNVTGNVTGNASGTAATVTGAAQSNITSVGTLTSATISGDLTVDTSTLKVDSSNNRLGVGTATPEAKLDVKVGSAGSVTAWTEADDFILESNAVAGISILTPDDASARLVFGSPSSNQGAALFYRQNLNKMNVGTLQSGGKLALRSGADVDAVVIDGNQNVGINQTAPVTPLHIGDSTGNPDLSGQNNKLLISKNGGEAKMTLFRAGTPANGTTSGEIVFGSSNSSGDAYWWQTARIRSVATNTLGGNRKGNLVFSSSGTNGTSVDAMTIEPVTSGSQADVTIETGNLIIGTAGKGIDFSVNSTENGAGASSVGKVLMDFEQGEYSPAISGSTGASSNLSASRKGFYTRIGDIVHVTIHIVNSSWNSGPSGDAVVTLPFTVKSNYSASATIGYVNNFDKTPINAYANQGSNLVYLFKSASTDITDTSAITNLQGSEVNSNSNIQITATYRVS